MVFGLEYTVQWLALSRFKIYNNILLYATTYKIFFNVYLSLTTKIIVYLLEIFFSIGNF